MTIFRHLNESAAKIQRGWRTFVRRREERCKLKEAVYQMRLAYYHQQATLVRTLKQIYSDAVTGLTIRCNLYEG